MSDYKPITGELRGAWIGQDVDTWMFDKELFGNLCDAIDAIHAGLEAENERLRQDVAIRSESEQEKCIDYLRKENIDWEDKYLDIAVENARLREQVDTLVMYVESDGTKYSVDCDGNQHFDHTNTCVPDGWIELPKDADGEYIHVGDMLAGENAGGFGLCEPFEVGCIMFGRDIIQVNDVHGLTRCVEFAHHYVPDTWERIISDAIHASESDELGDGSYEQAMAALVARCKKLAGDAE